MQNAAPTLTTPLQRGQVLVLACSAVAWDWVCCTGVPHSGQNFLPVKSFPQDVQVVIGLGLLVFRCL